MAFIDDDEDEMKKELTCSICLDYFRNPKLLMCGHSFCDVCLDSFICISKSCPMCKKKIHRESIRRHFVLNNIVDVYRRQSIKRMSTRASPEVTERPRAVPGVTPPNVERPRVEPRDANHLEPCCLCESLAPVAADVICHTCQLSFCEGCLETYHSGLDHNLMPLEGNLEMAAREIPRTEDPFGQLCRGQNPNVTVEVMGEFKELAVKTRCSLCETHSTNMATHKCLDCTLYLCWACVPCHQEQAPNHTLLEITVPGDLCPDVTVQRSAQLGKTQLKLIELMNIRSQVMTELLQVMRQRQQ